MPQVLKRVQRGRWKKNQDKKEKSKRKKKYNWIKYNYLIKYDVTGLIYVNLVLL